MIVYNDNELLYYVSRKSDIALEILIEKYIPLIKKKLKDYKIVPRFYDEFYQECIILLYESIHNFIPQKNSSFNHYFQISLNFHIRNMLKRNNNYFSKIQIIDDEILDTSYSSKDEYVFDNNMDRAIQKLSEDERLLYDDYKSGIKISKIADRRSEKYSETYKKLQIIKKKLDIKTKTELSNLETIAYNYLQTGYQPREIAMILDMDITVIYNALKRAKQKMKKKN